ncbi:low molecular weight protein-tyrosine-phosphatase [Burkholderia sp. lig30]|jgi:protein-tyrosine phosphatase|uniref:low molecular weight protein-tyrosine-phosphatase n=1 Tax=Burkholderia sp. lig30 TaxID=1192124 RepID=UPI001365E3D5|nr:low molecular weight protein-tyrosine-phosphatase [Burkholderia sp. lig30]
MNQTGKLDILVICTANICRSPVAEVILRNLLQEYAGVTVSSAGLRAPPGFPPDAIAESMASRFGYQIDPNKRSQRLAVRDVDRADVILAMEMNHLRHLGEQFPTTIGRSFLIGHWSGKEEVEDPVGQNEAVFTTVTKKLEKGCKQWAQQLLRTGLINI